jgi:hypothetical protein
MATKYRRMIMTYMQSKGIDRGRMIARGEGKKNPIRPNTIDGKDNPTGRQFNRRTEFRIIGELAEKRIIYDQNKPEYIDKSGNESRNKNLNADEPESDDNTQPDSSILPGSRVE